MVPDHESKKDKKRENEEGAASQKDQYPFQHDVFAVAPFFIGFLIYRKRGLAGNHHLD